jgi:hypothetical protein
MFESQSPTAMLLKDTQLILAQRKSNFGLLAQSWQLLERDIRSMDEAAKNGESYKVLFLGRHGQGWHNVAETKYGSKAWDVRRPLHFPLLLSILTEK